MHDDQVTIPTANCNDDDEMSWLRSLHPDFTGNQIECVSFLCELCRGHHHINAKIKRRDRGIEINTHSSTFATYDYDGLTRLVFMSHKYAIRAEIAASGPGMIKLILHKRHFREGRMHIRHPTIEQALAEWRGGEQS